MPPIASARVEVVDRVRLAVTDEHGALPAREVKFHTDLKLERCEVMDERKALVVGCGIAGPVVAMFLRRAESKRRPTRPERRPTIRPARS